MKIAQQTETTLQFQSNPVWWAILGIALMGGGFIYNARSKGIVLNKNSQNQTILEVVDRWIGLYETKHRHIIDVLDIEIRSEEK